MYTLVNRSSVNMRRKLLGNPNAVVVTPEENKITDIVKGIGAMMLPLARNLDFCTVTDMSVLSIIYGEEDNKVYLV